VKGRKLSLECANTLMNSSMFFYFLSIFFSYGGEGAEVVVGVREHVDEQLYSKGPR